MPTIPRRKDAEPSDADFDTAARHLCRKLTAKEMAEYNRSGRHPEPCTCPACSRVRARIVADVEAALA